MVIRNWYKPTILAYPSVHKALIDFNNILTAQIMKSCKVYLLIYLFVSAELLAAGPKVFTLVSPDGKVSAKIELKDRIYYSLIVEERQVITPSAIGMMLSNDRILGQNPVARKNRSRNVDNLLKPLYGERNKIRDNFNELIITFKGNFTLTTRLYNEGFAYRFAYSKKEDLIVNDELANFNFAGDYQVWAAHQRTGSFEHSYEDFYTVRNISQLPDSMAMLPVLVKTDEGLSALIMEADLEDYPGFHLKKNSSTEMGLEAAFPKVPTKWEPGGLKNFNLVVKERTNYIAKTKGARSFPWRIIKIATEDAQLLDTDIVYKLSSPAAEELDFSWVKPGKVAWDWWCAINLSGVNFRAGINTESYKYYIDFAAEHNIEYINLDEGWSDQYDLMKLDDQINLKEIIEYGHEKGVGVFLWCVHWPLDDKLDEAMDQFKTMGVKGLKIDFMDRDDQVMVNYYHRIAKAAAEHQLLVNYHGAYKPSGLHRKYPNVINRESVRGLEYNKFSIPHGTTPEYAVTIPFIRMAAGPMDYTPGAMTNAQQANFAVFFERPMSQGTRCQQLAMFVAYDAPLQMLADAPTAYTSEPEILKFLEEVPTTWDETVALDGELGDYLIIARQKEDTWYVGGMTDWDSRKLSVDFSFLKAGTYSAQIIQDGINADRIGNDYQILETTVDGSSVLDINLAPGGGFVIKIEEVK